MTSAAAHAGFAAGALTGRVAIVTGSASGIGAATASMLSELGADVVGVDRDPGAQVVHDLGDLDGLDALVGRIAAEHGTPDILVNAAGITGKTVLTTSRSEWERVLAVDLTAPFLLTRAVGERMITAGRGGSVVNVGSSSAYRAAFSGAAYGAAKAGLASLTRSAAWELGPHGVTVNLVAPGLTRTAITEEAFGDAETMARAVQDGPLANLLHRVSEPEDVAAVIAFLCLPAARQITGQVVHTSAGAVVAAG